MKTYGIRDLQRRPGDIVSDVAKNGKAALVTNRGKPMAALVPIDEEALEDWILANAPAFVRAHDEGMEEHREGKTIPLDEL